MLSGVQNLASVAYAANPFLCTFIPFFYINGIWTNLGWQCTEALLELEEAEFHCCGQ